MQTKPSALGQKIKQFRLINGIRQEDMADKLNISRATLINYEKGHTIINVETLDRLKKEYPDFNILEAKPKIIYDNYINFSVLFAILSKNRLFILTTSLIFSLIGYGFSHLSPERYNANITLYPAKKDLMQGLGQFQSLALNLGINKANNDQDFYIPDVVKSRLIAAKVVNQEWINIENEGIYLKDFWELEKLKWYNIFSTKNDSVKNFEECLDRLDDYINVAEDRLTGLITIETSFEDPKISSDIANFIGKEVQNYIQKENSAQSTKEKIFISDRLLIVGTELEKSESEIKNFLERNRGYDDSPELSMVYSRLLREFESKNEVYSTLQQQLELARIEEVRMSPILHILDYAVQPIRKSSPTRSLYLIVFYIFGIIISSSISIYRY